MSCIARYLEYVGDDAVIMVVLLLVELLQVGRVFVLAVRSHLVPDLSLLASLGGRETI